MSKILPHEISVIIETGHVLPQDEHLVFGPLPCPEPIYRRPLESTLPALLAEFGFFPSKTIARKSGWNPESGKYEIPFGFSDFVIGKKKRRLTVWKPSM